MKNASLALIGSLAALLGCAATPPTSLPASWSEARSAIGEDALVVMTWNVNYAVGEGPDVKETIRAATPDVILLQETTRAFERWALAHLAGPYPHMRFVYGPPPAGGMAVLSRFPLDEVEVLPSAVGLFPALRSVVRAPFGPVQVLNVHLHPPIHRGNVVAGYFTTSDERFAEMVRHLEELDAGLPTLIGGDFNEGGGDALRFAQSRGYRNALAETAPGTATWAWGVGPAKMRQALDHIYYGPRLGLVGAFAVEAGRSDHFPVVAAVRLDARRRHEGAARRQAAPRAASSSYIRTFPR